MLQLHQLLAMVLLLGFDSGKYSAAAEAGQREKARNDDEALASAESKHHRVSSRLDGEEQQQSIVQRIGLPLYQTGSTLIARGSDRDCYRLFPQAGYVEDAKYPVEPFKIALTSYDVSPGPSRGNSGSKYYYLHCLEYSRALRQEWDDYRRPIWESKCIVKGTKAHIYPQTLSDRGLGMLYPTVGNAPTLLKGECVWADSEVSQPQRKGTPNCIELGSETIQKHQSPYPPDYPSGRLTAVTAWFTKQRDGTAAVLHNIDMKLLSLAKERQQGGLSSKKPSQREFHLAGFDFGASARWEGRLDISDKIRICSGAPFEDVNQHAALSFSLGSTSDDLESSFDTI